MADPTYGSEVAPNGPVADMWQFDMIAGSPSDRTADQANSTAGAGPAGEHGLGGQAEGGPDGDTRYERIGF